MLDSLGLALIIGFVLLRLRSQTAPRAVVALPLLVVVWLSLVSTYAFVGHPGFFGEQMFVILRDQANLSRAPTIADRNERTRFVYATLTQQAARTQANLRAILNAGHIGYRPYYLMNAMEVDGGPLLRMMLASQQEVERIIDSPHLRPL